MERQRDEAEKNYQRCVQFAEADGAGKDYSSAARFYRMAADAGYAPAQYELAYLYQQGLAVC